MLKNFTFQALILSPDLKVIEHRGRTLVQNLYGILMAAGGDHLLPTDVRQQYRGAEESTRPRIICDFIAGMTDAYAVEYYGRLTSERPQSLFKPLA